jgi:hypothetical protein
MNSEALVPKSAALEQEVITLPMLVTVKLVAAPDDPTKTLPRFTDPEGEKLSLAEAAFDASKLIFSAGASEGILWQPLKMKRSVSKRLAFRAIIQESLK